MFEMLLGHFIGDYLLQNNWMALKKMDNTGLGWLACIVHCLIYTLAVCLLMWEWNILWMTAVFLSHFFIDKFGLAEAYLKLINGRSLNRFIADPANKSYSPTVALQSGFYVFVYVVVDNTMHIVLMYGAWRLLFT